MVRATIVCRTALLASLAVPAIDCVLAVTGSDHKAGGSADAAQQTGESTRLKLQTPLFVADALVQAAEQQLDFELTACKEEVWTGQSGHPAHHARN